jgi:discoidin domain receptor family protein 2
MRRTTNVFYRVYVRCNRSLTRMFLVTEQGKHSTKSDVWSFAVTLWEILMLCAQQPFAELTSEQVIENCNHWYQNDGLQRYLSRPPACPREIYDLMGECWKRHEVDRPRFGEIHLFLQRKNLGYIPANG